jgi:alpha-glucosidase (family GH31 glycosyl hydrolase)
VGRIATNAAAALLCCAALLCASARAAAVDRTVASGSLTASVAPDPWHLSFTEHGGREVLAELSGGAGTGPSGTLGFATGATWWHATRVVNEQREGHDYVASLATSDPAGRRLELRIAPDAEGVIQVDARVTGALVDQVSATGIAFASRPGERYLGFGERSNAVDQRGGEVENYVAEGPYQPAERAAIAAFVPPPGYRPRDDATYFPMPWLLSTRGYGLLVNNNETSTFRLGSDAPGAWSVEAAAGALSFRVFAGPKPADVLRRLTARLGRQPPAAAPFYFGPWFQPKGDDHENLKALARADAPASVVQTYTHYLPCGDHQGQRPQQAARTSMFHAAGLAVTTYFNPMICTSYQPRYDEARASDVLTKNAVGQPYEYRYTGASQFFVGQFDFSAPAATGFYGSLLDEAVQDGYDGWMEDFGEYTPTDARSANGMNGLQMHNYYPVLYHGAARAFAAHAPRPLARFNRSGWTGAAAVSQIVWGGDPSTDFGYDGLASAVRNGITMGLSGVSLWGSDIGGYFSLSSPELTPELLIRWLEFGFASGVMRTEANGFTLPPKGHRAQIFDPDVRPTWRRYAKLRTQLYPYLAAAEQTYDHTGLPLMRHLSLAYPGDERSLDRDDEYLFGPDLLVAPVIVDAARTRSLYLPPGNWVDMWRSASFQTRTGGLALGGARVLGGGRDVTVPAPLDELPLFVRAGALIPLLPPDVDTLADYGHGRGIVKLSDRRDRMTLLAFPRGRSHTSLPGGETIDSVEGKRQWDVTVSARRQRTYTVDASTATLSHPFSPCWVLLDGRSLTRSAWRYDARTHVLHVVFRTRTGRLSVRSSCPRRAR